MGVYVSPRIVKRKDKDLIEVIETGMPVSNPIYELNNLIFLDELKSSLLDIASKDLDLSFFTKPNDSSYGNMENINTSFTPEEVLKCISLIRYAFEKRGNEFIKPTMYEGVFDENGKQIRKAFIEFQRGMLFWKKKIIRSGSLTAHQDKVSYQWYDDENQKWGGSIDLSKEKPILFRLTFNGQEKIKGEQLNYTVKSVQFYDLINPELSNIETLANYAKDNGYELQIVHG